MHAFIFVRLMYNEPSVCVVMEGDNPDEDNCDEDGQIVPSFFRPLTIRGCIQLGKFIAEQKATSFFYSSSADFAHEYKPGFRHDVRELVQHGYRRATQ